MKTYYTIYQTTNKLSGKTYIGSHKTTNLDDNYLGSGKYLLHAIKKHGVDNFKKEILHIFDSPKDMYDMEAKLVNEEFLTEANTYNLKVGGFGGWDYVNSDDFYNSSHTVEHMKMMSVLGKTNSKKKLKELFNDKAWAEEFSKKRSERQKEQYQNGRINAMQGKQLTENHKAKIGEANSIKQKGKLNSQYGKRFKWMNKSKINKKVPLGEVETLNALGWKPGRSK